MLLTPSQFWLGIVFALCLGIFSRYSVAANVDVSGIKSDKILANVNAHLDSVEPPAAPYQFEQYQQQLIEKVNEGTQVFGYYHVQVEVTPPEQKNKKDKWRVAVQLGRVTTIRKLNIEVSGDGKNDPLILAKIASLPLAEDKPLEHSAYESSKSQLQNLALSLGYFDFNFSQHKIEVYESSYNADISLIMQTGPRYHFGKLRFPEDARAQSLVLDSLPFEIGQPYEADKLAELNKRLKQTQYFRHVLVRPIVSDAIDNNVPIEVMLTHKPRDNFDLGAGADSDIGPRFTAKWQRPWVNSAGHSMSAELFLSEPERSISFDYRIPIEDPVHNYANFQLGYQIQDDNDTTSDKLTFSATRHWTVVGSDWQRAAFLRLEQETFAQGIEPEQTTRLVTPGFTLSRLRTKGGLDIYWGDKQTITLETAADSFFSDINLLRVTAQTKWLRSWDEHRLLFRADLGAVETNDFDQVPSSLRYFAGGDQSIRGFGYRTLSPFDYDEKGKRQLTGGKYLAVGSVEYSYPVAEKWRLALFVDAGNSTNKFNGNITTGVGTGLNWLSPVGPIRVYLARGNSEFESTWRIHFSMGPAL